MRINIGLDTKISSYFGVKPYVGLKYGIELEYENAHKDKLDLDKTPLTLWKVEKDDSLRNNGIEFVSRPTTFDKLGLTLDQGIAAAKSIGCTPTVRCGLHVHVNMTDRTFRDLFNLSVLYTLLEPVLFAEYADGRQENHFCVPTYNNTVLVEHMYNDIQRLRRGHIVQMPESKKAKPPKWKRPVRSSPFAQLEPVPMSAMQLDEALTDMSMHFRQVSAREAGLSEPGNSVTEFAPAHLNPPPLKFPHVAKYAALNFSALRKFGTVEYRQHPATMSKLQLSEWIGIIHRIHTYALTFHDPLDIINLYDSDGLAALCLKVGLKNRRQVDPLDLEDAVDAATLIAGHQPIEWNELKWEIA